MVINDRENLVFIRMQYDSPISVHSAKNPSAFRQLLGRWWSEILCAWTMRTGLPTAREKRVFPLQTHHCASGQLPRCHRCPCKPQNSSSLELAPYLPLCFSTLGKDVIALLFIIIYTHSFVSQPCNKYSIRMVTWTYFYFYNSKRDVFCLEMNSHGSHFSLMTTTEEPTVHHEPH